MLALRVKTQASEAGIWRLSPAHAGSCKPWTVGRTAHGEDGTTRLISISTSKLMVNVGSESASNAHPEKPVTKFAATVPTF
jgi:hypothetical protein